ncbi:MAG: TfoX/Sxy family protein [Acidimicrobiales bacterium]
MQIPKPSPDDLDYFRSIVPDDPRVEVKPMFGNVAAFVNGNMFAGLFGADVGVKLADADRGELTAAGGGPFGPPERPMGGYVALPAAWRADRASTDQWMARALDHVSALPAKAPKARKPKKAKPA